MLPVVAGDDETRRQIVVYAGLLVISTLLLFPLGGLGLFYVVSAGMLGGVFVVLALQLQHERTTVAAVRVFRYSIVYLALLFVAMVADRMLRA